GLGTITNDDVTLPSITLAVSSESVTEDGTTNLVYTFTRTGATTDALTVNYTVGGTATFDTDYTQTGAASFTATTGTVTFAAGSDTATVTIDPTADTNVEDDETVTLNLAPGTGYAIGTTDAVVGIITDTDNETPSNQAPTDLALSATTVNENVAPNTVIGTFSTTDPDTGNNFTYSLIAGTGDTDNSAFSIVGNQLQINNSPDFETKNSYSIRVKTTDQGGLSFEKTLTITVNDVNENPSNQAPTALIFQNAVTELAENVDVTPEFKVADLLIEDDGLGTNNLFLTGRDRERFLIQNSALFFVGFTPNFEAQNSYEVTVNVDDTTVGVTPDLTQTLTLNITDVNEAPTALILANSTKAIAENTDTSQGVKVADIQISDDALGTNSLSLLGSDQSSFQIRGRELFFIGKADFEAQSLYNLTVAVTDKLNGFYFGSPI
ncbi:MAG: cadherin domain-containing protein, partial [Microcystis sp.]|uniref:cadherin domain-containing protein n=1 Tax=Microcystis sp. TaxID=1127 RepID=UPI0039197CB4